MSSQKEVYRRISDDIGGNDPLICFIRLSFDLLVMSRESFFFCGKLLFRKKASLAAGPSLLKVG